MNAFSIKDIENLTGIQAHTIRIWEQRYSFLAPHRTNTNIRYYTNEQLKSILDIALLNKIGYKVSFIDRMGKDEIKQKLQQTKAPQAQQELTINELIGYMIDLKVHELEATLSKFIETWGLSQTAEEVMEPFMVKAEMLWRNSSLNAAIEHITSHIISRKLFKAIDKGTNDSSNIKALLFLPEGEYHELWLIYVHYLMRAENIDVLYLGQDVPLEDLKYVVNAKKPYCLYTHLTSNAHRFSCERFALELNKEIGNRPVYASGPLAVNCTKSLPKNFVVKQSIGDVKEAIKQLRN